MGILEHRSSRAKKLGGDSGRRNWRDLLPRLLRWTKGAMLRSSVAGLALGEEAGDFVNEAIVRVLTGKRRQPDGLDDYPFFVGVIRSVMSHDIEQYFRRKTTAVDPDSLEIPDSSSDPERLACSSKEFRQVLDKISDDELREFAIYVYVFGLSKPKELSEILEISLKKAKSLKRRLTRKLKNILKGQKR